MSAPRDRLGVISPPTSPAGFSPPTDPRKVELVGRDHELEGLEQALGRAGAGELRAVLILGEPGVGKTRLATELAARHRGEVLTLSARAYPLGATASLGLWAEGIERHLRGLDRSEVLSLCAGDLDDLCALLPSARAAQGAVSAPSRPGSVCSAPWPGSSAGSVPRRRRSSCSTTSTWPTDRRGRP